jgi:hypothetical protein
MWKGMHENRSELPDSAQTRVRLSEANGPAPRVAVRQAEAGQVIEPVLDEAAEPKDFHSAFCAAFATVDDVVAEALFGQLLNGLHTEPGEPVDSITANLALALMHALGPQDVIEGLIAVQMIITHVAALDASRRALHVEQSSAGRTAYLSLARKLMTLFATQVGTLDRHRGKGTTQKIVIERVYVAPGARAIVGAVAGPSTSGGGG